MTIKKLLPHILRVKKVIQKKDFYRYNTIKIKDLITLGNKNASWTIANQLIMPNSIVYSLGVGTDLSFDLKLIEKFNVTVHAFDPTPKSISWLNEQLLPDKFHFYPYGIADFCGEIEFTLPSNSNHVSGSIENHLGSTGKTIQVPVKDLITIMGELNHNHIDILKMDIEGAEYDVIDHIINNKIEVKQLLVEFHHRFPKIGIQKSKKAIRDLKQAGYKIFHISNNGEEYSFIKD